jgi:hypothetical protein
MSGITPVHTIASWNVEFLDNSEQPFRRTFPTRASSPATASYPQQFNRQQQFHLQQWYLLSNILSYPSFIHLVQEPITCFSLSPEMIYQRIRAFPLGFTISAISKMAFTVNILEMPF